MSVFSLYTGLLYNEFFSVPMTIFGGTRFVCPSDPNKDLDACPEASTTGLQSTGPYPFGADPIWHGTRSELPFFNSMKMKMSILFGVTHMMLGLFVSAANFLYTKDFLSLYCEFIPQVLFLGSIFGYLSLLIIIKWATPGCTSDLYHIMIYMFLAVRHFSHAPRDTPPPAGWLAGRRSPRLRPSSCRPSACRALRRAPCRL